MSKILVFTTAIEHSTFRKTAMMLANSGAKVHVVGFTRNNFPASENKGYSIESLGTLSHGNYFKRFVKLLKFLLTFRKKAKDYDVIYNFTLDTLIISKLSLLFIKKTWVYQIQDIRSIFFGKSIISTIARWVEKTLVKRIDLLVVSSIDYYTGYFKTIHNVKPEKVFVIENKLINQIRRRAFEDKLFSINKINIGYFGVMRCERSWEILKDLALKYPEKFSLYMRGKPVAMPNLEEEIRNIPNIEYGGVYKSPDDLAELYDKVDIVWACYPYNKSKEGNWKLARTIRFYEACAYNKPIIVQRGTAQEKDTLNNNLGLVIDMSNIEKTLNQLNSMSFKDFEEWHRNLSKLDVSFYTHTDEYEALFKKIKEINHRK